MKKPVSGWGAAASLARAGDRILDTVLAFLLIVALLFGGFGLWDTWNIYQNAKLDNDLMMYKPPAHSDPSEPNPSLEELQKINPDVIAWLTVDGTSIDYPVVQGEDNIYYLNRDVYQEFTLCGSLFLDYQNARDFSDFDSLIYGHHLAGGVMFGELTNFVEQDYFDSHQTASLAVPERTYAIEWFACLETNAYDAYMYEPTRYTDPASQSELLQYIKDTATQYREVGVSPSDRIVSLSTCADGATDGRVILVGKLS
jgi:sortase B